MRIAIIGAGNMGSALARALAAARFELNIGHRVAAKATALADEVGHGTRGSGIADALKGTDTAFLAVPYGAMREVISSAGDISGKTLIDLSNPITPDFKSLVVGHTSSAAEEIQAMAPAAQVVKAFNTIFAPLLSPDARRGRGLQVFIAGDSQTAKEQVNLIVRSMGFEAVDAGPLSNSRFLEPMGEMNIHFGYFLGLGLNAAPAWVSE